MTIYPPPEELRGDLPADIDPNSLDWDRLELLIKLSMYRQGQDTFERLTAGALPIPDKPGQTILDLELLPFDQRGFITVRKAGEPFCRVHWTELDPTVPPLWLRPPIDA
jgi:hypothetical protein